MYFESWLTYLCRCKYDQLFFYESECFFGSFFPKSCGCLKVGGAAYTRVFTVSVTFHSINCNQGSYKKSKPFFPDFSRTKLNFQALPTRNVISWTVYKFTFPVQANRYLMLQVFVPSPFLHLSVHLPFLFISSGFSIRIKVGGRNEVGSEGATCTAGATF